MRTAGNDVRLRRSKPSSWLRVSADGVELRFGGVGGPETAPLDGM